MDELVLGIPAPHHRVLADERKLRDPKLDESTGFFLDHIRGPRAELPSHQGDGAERAAPVASLGDLQVRPRRAAEPQAGGRGDGRIPPRGVEPGTRVTVDLGLELAGRDRRDDLVDARVGGEVDQSIHLGQRVGQVVGAARNQTSGQDQAPKVAVRLQFRKIEDLFDRLPSRGIDEPARIDDDDVRSGGIVRHPMTAGRDHPTETL